MATSGGPKLSDLITSASVRNATIMLRAIGGSTNGLIHLIASPRGAGGKVDLEAFDQLGREIPVLLNLKPSGAHFHHAGGMPALMRELSTHLDTAAPTVSRLTLGDAIAHEEVISSQDVIRSSNDACGTCTTNQADPTLLVRLE